MNTDAGRRLQGDGLCSPDPDPCGDPLRCIHDSNLCERGVCAILERIATPGEPERGAAERALRFLREQLPLHMEDEERDLFPLLRRRCGAEDEIDRAIQRLRGGHRQARADLPEVIAILERLRAGTAGPSAGECAVLRRHAGHARRHLTLENAIILPFARLRLKEEDLADLRLQMMRRRGLDRPGARADAE